MGFGVKQADLAAILADTGTTLPATGIRPLGALTAGRAGV
ncbi:hypothetical protein LCGC14_1350590 [marine sediment metagenome]|uniref:Uncharacterized protein n=1 Tax=marine sediment metagenome TaxID=412755 RepID=A0A0F9MRV7_9ZZZZ